MKTKLAHWTFVTAILLNTCFALVHSIAQDTAAATSVSTLDLRAQALSSLNSGNYKAAIEAADAMIRLNGADTRTMRLAADVYLRSGEIDFAVQLFDRFVEMEPKQMPEMWQRGIALYFAGEYEKAAKQFEEHRVVNPYDVENAAWHYLCVSKAFSPDKANKLLLPAPNDARAPMTEIMNMLTTGSVDAINERVNAMTADSASRKEASFYADLYMGLYFDAQGDQKKAREFLARSAKDAPHHYMGDVARVYAELVGKEPK